jgi:tetratricopeptide (TPR) repeat protein
MEIKNARSFWLPGIAAIAFLVYLPSLRGGFSWDEINMFSGSSGFMPFYGFGYHRPLFISFLRLEQALFGDNAVLYHIMNSALHAANVVMVFFVAGRLLHSRPAAIISALLFALHPANSEAVAWIFTGSELLKTFLMLISLNLYLMYREDNKVPALLAGALFCLLACLSGQGALVLPLAILFYDWLILGSGFRRLRLPVLIYLASIVVYMAAFRGAGEILSLAGAQALNLYHFFSSLGYYALKLLLPFNLSLLPPLDDTPIYMVTALALLGLPFFLRKRWRKESFLLFFILIMLLPPLLVAMSGSAYPLWMSSIYPVSIGFSMLVSLLIIRISNPRAMVTVASVLAVLYAVGSFDRALVWGDRTELWREAAGENNTSVMHKINLAASLVQLDRIDETKLQLRMALQDPNVKSDEFKRVMEMLYEISPESDDEMLELLSEAKGPTRAYLGMGFYYFDLYSNGETRDKAMLGKSIKYLLSAVEEDQSLVMARYYLGLGYLETGQYDKSIDQLMAVNSMDFAGQYSSDTEFYLGLARKMKAISGIQFGKSPAKE